MPNQAAEPYKMHLCRIIGVLWRLDVQAQPRLWEHACSFQNLYVCLNFNPLQQRRYAPLLVLCAVLFVCRRIPGSFAAAHWDLINSRIYVRAIAWFKQIVLNAHHIKAYWFGNDHSVDRDRSARHRKKMIQPHQQMLVPNNRLLYGFLSPFSLFLRVAQNLKNAIIFSKCLVADATYSNTSSGEYS